jgi:hypothetical protein
VLIDLYDVSSHFTIMLYGLGRFLIHEADDLKGCTQAQVTIAARRLCVGGNDVSVV